MAIVWTESEIPIMQVLSLKSRRFDDLIQSIKNTIWLLNKDI